MQHKIRQPTVPARQLQPAPTPRQAIPDNVNMHVHRPAVGSISEGRGSHGKREHGAPARDFPYIRTAQIKKYENAKSLGLLG
jgi:hypothetical protein